MAHLATLRIQEKIVRDPGSYTQGLTLGSGYLWESVGRYGKSALRRYALDDYSLKDSFALPDEYYGEGICWIGQHVWQLTWREGVALKWSFESCDSPRFSEVRYDNEGWGICKHGATVFTSDGSHILSRRSPHSLLAIDAIKVTMKGRPIAGLNDLTWWAGRVWANIYGSPIIVGIDSISGEVTHLFDATEIQNSEHATGRHVMNGITASPGTGKLILTGKNWTSFYCVDFDNPRELAGTEITKILNALPARREEILNLNGQTPPWVLSG